MPERITIDDIEKKQFSVTPDGYSKQEVDEYLDLICDELDRLLLENRKLHQELEGARAAVSKPQAAPAPITRTPTQGETQAFREILEMAQKVKDDTINAAKGQADAIVADAQREADARLGDLNAQHDRLSQQVAELKHVAQEYRNRFESLLAAQQDALDKASDLF